MVYSLRQRIHTPNLETEENPLIDRLVRDYNLCRAFGCLPTDEGLYKQPAWWVLCMGQLLSETNSSSSGG